MYIDCKKGALFSLFLFIFTLLLSGCNKTEPPKLVLSEDNWHYGKVTPGQNPSHNFTIKNEGGEKLVIESVYSSCPCVILELPEKEILPFNHSFIKFLSFSSDPCKIAFIDLLFS